MPRGEASYKLPQRALVETLWVEDGTALGAARVEVETGRDGEAEEETVVPEQVPKSDLQLEPQYALLLPQ
jgi:hypothetical protein